MSKSDICLCFDISESDIERAIKEGHNSMEELAEHLQVGTHCGGCVGCVEDILEESKNGVFVRIFGRKH